MTCKYLANRKINQKASVYLILSIIVVLTFAFDNDAFAVVYHYSPSFIADGKTVLDVTNTQDLRLTSFTVATWFKTTANFPDEGVMVNKGGLGSESAGGNQNYGIWFTSSERLQGGFETTGGSNKYISSPNTYNDGQWHHGVVTFDDAGNIVRLFVDGVQIGTLSTSSTPDNTGSQPLRIAGNAQSLLEDFFVGELDEIGVWNTALSQTDITNLMNNGVFVSTGLVFRNSFDNLPPPAVEICDNGVDDDGDGFKDAEDVNSRPAVPEICTNGLDDDRDGFKDGTDSDCQQATGYHYSPSFIADGKTVLDVTNTQDLRLTSFTVATWFKTTANFPDEGVMVNKGGLGSESAGGNQNYGIWFTSSERLQGGFETTGGSNKYISSPNTYNDGQWHHGVVTFDDAGNIVRLFVDGVQIGTLSTSSTPDNTGSQPLRIAGNAQSLLEDFFVGELDEIGVWNTALSQTDITNLMNNGVFVSTGLVFRNSFDNLPPPAVEICDNGVDDDGDGFKDAEDVNSRPAVPEICTNGLDDDRDGFKDASDPDCAPPSGNTYPVSNIIWAYDSKQTLSTDITIPDKMAHPNDPVLWSSGASGVDSHSIRNGWLEIDSGGGNGRVYWNYHVLPYFSQLSTAGYNTIMTGTFMFKPGIDNLSIKDGNHGTDGWILDGQLVFGGFGVAFHRTEVESKVEYWHNRQGSGVTVAYPNGLNLIDNKEYKFFITYITDRVNQQVVLNAWLDFGNGNGWVKVMTDRKWGQSGWDPGSVPNGADRADILKGPSFIKKHHIWTRANSGGGGVVLPVKDIKIGTIGFIS